ncbi:MAG: pyridoxal-phosphate dependent enzyme [Oscillospiraceae bacterium]
MEIPLQEFERAAQRLKGVLHHTELDLSATFSAMTGGNIYLKYENSQKTGSFKIRGASNKIAALVERGETGAVVASSAGNHAQGVAYAAHRFGIPATIVMPKTAPIAKAKATEGYGANVVLAGDCYDDAYAKACEICEQEHATFLHPYNDPEVIAGQGTSASDPRRPAHGGHRHRAAGGGGCLPVWPRASSRSTPAYRSSACRPRAQTRSRSRSTAQLRPDRCRRHHCRRHRRQGAGRHHRPAHPEICRRRRHRQRSRDLEAVLLHGALQADRRASGAAPVAAVLKGKVDVKGKTSCACSPAATST